MREETKRDTAPKARARFPTLISVSPFVRKDRLGVSSVCLSPSYSHIPSGSQNLGCGAKGGRTTSNSNSILLASCTYPTPR